MRMSFGDVVIQLARGKMLAVRDARNIILRCTEGVIWLTIEGHPHDLILSKGERLRIESNGLALIQGLPSGSIQLASTAAGSRQERGTRDSVSNGIDFLFHVANNIIHSVKLLKHSVIDFTAWRSNLFTRSNVLVTMTT